LQNRLTAFSKGCRRCDPNNALAHLPFGELLLSQFRRRGSRAGIGGAPWSCPGTTKHWRCSERRGPQRQSDDGQSSLTSKFCSQIRSVCSKGLDSSTNLQPGEQRRKGAQDPETGRRCEPRVRSIGWPGATGRNKKQLSASRWLRIGRAVVGGGYT